MKLPTGRRLEGFSKPSGTRLPLAFQNPLLAFEGSLSLLKVFVSGDLSKWPGIAELMVRIGDLDLDLNSCFL